MPSDFDLTAGSWRTRRARPGIDPAMKRLGLMAAGIAGITALAVGGWQIVGHRPHAVPVIEADSRPLRVKPENPGGMQIAGAEEQIMGGAGSGQADAMAPPAEAPAPQALRAQVKAAKPAEPASPPVAAAPPPPPAPPVPKPVQVAPKTSGVQVQLAAMDTEQGARVEWQRLAKKMPELLGARQPSVQRLERDGRTLWRLRTSGFADAAAATGFCTQVRTKGGACAVASF